MLINHRRSGAKGVALIVTLVILVLLAGLAVGLLQTSGLERGTSRSVADKAKADLIAQTAANAAIAQLVGSLNAYPDSATTWETINNNEGTVLYYRDKTPEAAVAAGVPAELYVLPLVSGGIPQKVADKANALPTLTDTPVGTANAYNFNRTRFSGDTQGWIGSSAKWVSGAPSSPQPFRGQWIDVTDSDGKVTGRYAFWVEDESFKANVNLLGRDLRGATTAGSSPSEIPLEGLFKVALTGGDPAAAATAVLDYRGQFPNSRFFEYRALNQVNGQPTLADSAKFNGTIYSGALNLSRSGAKRVNLNKVVSTSTDAMEIRKQLDEIIKPIRYELPNFGQRFYRTGTDLNSTSDVPETGTTLHQTIYLNKIAANIRDYIDSDSQPTVVNNDAALSVRIGPSAKPAHPFEAIGGGTAGLNEVVAIGKERVPMMQEYALRVRQIEFAPQKPSAIVTAANYKIAIDHYIEFWNMSNRDILVSDLGPNPFVLIANQPSWDAGSLDDIPESPARDMQLFLKDAKQGGPTGASLVSFPAGSCTVITTDPQPLPALTPDVSRVYYIPIQDNGTTGLRTYAGKTNRTSSNNFRLNLVTRTTTSTDYETEIAIGNDIGMLESDWGGGIINSVISINTDVATEDRFDDTKYHFRGGSLRGNSSGVANATTGDPRTMAEQIRMDLNGSGAGNDKTRYFTSGLDSNSVPGNSTITAPNANFCDPGKWPDFSSSAQNAQSAPMVIANSPLTSIGQLGDIFDPVRTKGDGADVSYSRSGGRTLKIGQPERRDATTNPAGLWDGNSNSKSREWTAWRLADVFSTSDAVQLDGLVNINGVNRDDGAALKAALYGYVFGSVPDTDGNLAGKPFDTDPTSAADKINVLIAQLQARVKNDGTSYPAFTNTSGPLSEPAEISELPMFNSGTDLVAGVDTTKVNDRGREELFRRLIGLTTTRGNVFSVYAVGQSTVPRTGALGPIVSSTALQKITFRIDPVWNAGTPSDPFDPATNARFAKPDKYAVKILSASE